MLAWCWRAHHHYPRSTKLANFLIRGSERSSGVFDDFLCFWGVEISDALALQGWGSMSVRRLRLRTNSASTRHHVFAYQLLWQRGYMAGSGRVLGSSTCSKDSLCRDPLPGEGTGGPDIWLAGHRGWCGRRGPACRDPGRWRDVDKLSRVEAADRVESARARDTDTSERARCHSF